MTPARRRQLLLLAASLLSGAEAFAAPAPHLTLPAPTGPATVGSLVAELVDPGREESYTADPKDHRRVVVQAWFPAAATSPCKHLPYMDERTAHADAGDGESLPADLSQAVGVHACAGATPAGGAPFPVVLFSHGLGATRFSYQSLYEELASRGYAVIAIQHPYGSRITAFADGGAAVFDDNHWWSKDDAVRQRLMELGTAIWIADARLVLARLERLTPGDADALGRLAGRLDLAHLGYAGHSFGGAIAVLTAEHDPRIRAVANLDGRLPVPKEPVLAQPVMTLVNAGSPRRDERPAKREDIVARIAGSTHISFGDQTLLSETFAQAKDASAAPKLDGRGGIAITREALVDFFDCTLRGDDSRCKALRAALDRAAVSIR